MENNDQTANTENPVKVKKPLYKRTWFIILTAIIALSFFGSLGSGNDGSADPTGQEPTTAGSAVHDQADPDQEPERQEDPAPEPEPEPLPIPEPVVYTGSGDDVIRIDSPEDGPVMLYIEGNSSSGHFAVTGYDSNDNKTKLFVNTTDPYQGITLDPGGTTGLLEINAPGSWTIESRSLRSARTINVPGSISGSGDEVILVAGSPSMASIQGNQAERHFAVMGYSPSRNLMVNTTDFYDGTLRADRDTFVLEITAVGDWVIALE